MRGRKPVRSTTSREKSTTASRPTSKATTRVGLSKAGSKKSNSNEPKERSPSPRSPSPPPTTPSTGVKSPKARKTKRQPGLSKATSNKTDPARNPSQSPCPPTLRREDNEEEVSFRTTPINRPTCGSSQSSLNPRRPTGASPAQSTPDHFQTIGEMSPQTKNKWTLEMEEKLCELWEEETHLYDSTSVDYRYTHKRLISIQRFAAVLDVDGMYELWRFMSIAYLSLHQGGQILFACTYDIIALSSK